VSTEGEGGGDEGGTEPVQAPEAAPIPSPEELFALLDAADAAGRAEMVLWLLGADPGRPLDLSARDGLRAVLDGIDLGRAGLESRLGLAAGSEPVAEPPPPWWDGAARGVVMRGANLRGARLAGAVLRGADLRGVDLQGAVLGAADLRGARLEEADLAGADLAGADLRAASLGNADLRGAMLEDANLRRAGLRFARLDGAALDGADLHRADLWGASLENASLAKADLRAAVLREARLGRADLSGALLRGADLGQADCQRANLTGADLRRANVPDLRLPAAVLRDARLDELDLAGCDLAHAHLGGASLAGTRLRAEQFGGAIGEEVAGDFGEARKGYLALERNFQDSGDPGAASWAFRRRRRMQKCEALRLARAARAEGRYREAAPLYFDYASDQLVEWLCDYGESGHRVLLSMLAVYLAFTLLYGLTGGVVRVERTPSGGEVSTPTRDPLDLAIFSLLSMTAGNPPNGMEPRNDAIILLSGVEALLGVGLTGLLGFVLGNLVRR
jgi:uncharacterized protein YjbI with pentapeptide repeats